MMTEFNKEERGHKDWLQERSQGLATSAIFSLWDDVVLHEIIEVPTKFKIQKCTYFLKYNYLKYETAK